MIVAGVALVAVGGAIAWWQWRDHEAAAPVAPTAARAMVPEPAVAAPVVVAPAAPVAPSPPVRVAPAPGPDPGVAAAGPSVAFEDEPRDPAWADEHERELTLRLRDVAEALEGSAVTLGKPECRRSLCKVAITAADTGALGKVYGALESEDGLHGWADTMLLEHVVTRDDGKVETSVIAQFVRDEP